MKIICVKTPKFLRPLLKLFTRKKRRGQCLEVDGAPAENKAAESSETA